MPNEDVHYWKYRVFREPQISDDDPIGHPVNMSALFLSDEVTDEWSTVEEIGGSFFVLRPEHDHHARVAMAAYAYSCRKELPNLAADLIGMIESLEWEEETGQHCDDLPVTSEDLTDVTGEQLGEAAVSYLKRKFEETK